MKAQDFEKCSKEIINHCFATLFKKKEEYASDTDRLDNFKQPTSLFRTNPAKICMMYDSKHIASMVKMAEDVDKGILPTREMLEEKVGDYINYGLLFYANMLEIMNDKLDLAIQDIDGVEYHYAVKELEKALEKSLDEDKEV